MRRKENVVGTLLSVFILLSTSVLASTIQSDFNLENNGPLKIENEDTINLFFQTIDEMVLDVDIQKFIENNEIKIDIDKYNTKILYLYLVLYNPTLLILFRLNQPILSENNIKYIYRMVKELSCTYSISEMKSLNDCVTVQNSEMLNEVSIMIENNDNLNEKIKKIIDLNCDCNFENSISFDFPVICSILSALLIIGILLSMWFDIDLIGIIAQYLGQIFNCW